MFKIKSWQHKILTVRSRGGHKIPQKCSHLLPLDPIFLSAPPLTWNPGSAPETVAMCYICIWESITCSIYATCLDVLTKLVYNANLAFGLCLQVVETGNLLTSTMMMTSKLLKIWFYVVGLQEEIIYLTGMEFGNADYLNRLWKHNTEN
jgi:hypothetical protein